MVKVKLDRFGLREERLELLLNEKIGKLQQIEQIEGKQLHEVATELFLDVFSSVVGEEHFFSRMVRVGRMEMVEESEEGFDRGRGVEREMGDHGLVEASVESRALAVLREGAILCNICYTTVYHYC